MVVVKDNIIGVSKIIINNNNTSWYFLMLSGNLKLPYDYISRTFFKAQNYRDGEEISGCRG